MAVPKRKTGKSKKNMRRAANSKYVAPGYVKCPQCHEPKLSHRVCPECGYYKNKEVITVNE
ncbi:50S ribosomal protein L32 [Clostridium formicaceticum]|uniref:Large ribosomal subunit protein bL32 n=1 Tax=Clostridium formicaceticum TaxID=1497 RepID=A0AAC9WGG1_9CLOT|nr:50S ribosomal protein L32 [Clostridium formicaceticum]AOY77354.1 50S ribosomal protein L32 [Clostridium formicaceticum]ARE87898.1 50S ribosomal protein L32 [Clostridium formicaceticum]